MIIIVAIGIIRISRRATGIQFPLCRCLALHIAVLVLNHICQRRTSYKSFSQENCGPPRLSLSLSWVSLLSVVNIMIIIIIVSISFIISSTCYAYVFIVLVLCISIIIIMIIIIALLRFALARQRPRARWTPWSAANPRSTASFRPLMTTSILNITQHTMIWYDMI